MFGLEILDVVIGLMFVYLLLALLATALNEYLSAVLNLRGRELARGLGRLLDDLDEKDAVRNALDGVGSKITTRAESLTEQFYNHRLIRPYATRRGRFGRFLLWIRRRKATPRLPSYMPARTFALALLDLLGIDDKDAKLEKLVDVPDGMTLAQAVAHWEQQAATAAAAAREENTEAARKAALDAGLIATKAKLAHVLTVLKQQSSVDLAEHLGTLGTLPQADKLAGALQVQVAGLLADSQTQLQKLHDGVEIWFNNSMDRVSGAYKRNIQGWLFAIGLLIASCSNADTVDMWRRLSANDELSRAMADRAARRLPMIEPRIRRDADTDTTQADTTRAADTQTDTTADTEAGDSLDVEAGSQEVADTTPGSSAEEDTVPTDSGATDTVAGDTTDADSAAGPSTPADSAWEAYEVARAELDSMELKLGWTTAEGVRVGLLKKDAPRKATVQGREGRAPAQAGREKARPQKPAQPKQPKQGWVPAGYHLDLFPFDTHSGPFFGKLLGLLLTAIAISLGAPFWFDMLNKVISIRGAGRSPEEKAKSPQAPAKRAGEERPK